MKGSEAVWLFCTCSGIGWEAKMADKRQSGSVRVVPEERKAAEGGRLVAVRAPRGGEVMTPRGLRKVEPEAARNG